jgi:putative membrane protein
MGRASVIINFFQGVMIGTADLFPGISGGTIALIMGIYGRFMQALSSFNRPLLRSLLRPDGERSERIRKLDLVFLLPLLVGIGAAIFLGARGTSYLIETHPVVVMSFFFGFLLLSLRIPWRMVKKKDARSYISLFIAFLAAAAISVYGGGSLPSGPAFTAASGFVAVSFMLLPGVSGSSALLLLGTYADIIAAVGTLDLSVLLPFVLGAGLGVVFITRLLNRMLRDHLDATMAALTGLLAGSMARVWPLRTEEGFAGGIPTFSADILSVEILSAIALGAGIIFIAEKVGKKIVSKRVTYEEKNSE